MMRHVTATVCRLVVLLHVLAFANPAYSQGRTPWRRPGFAMVLPATNVIKLLVVRVNCSDAEIPCSEKDLYASTFGDENSINAVFKNSSYGKWRVEGDVISVTFNGLKSSLHCTASGRSDWFQANIDPLIRQQGRSLDGYYKVLYVLPPRICPWTGNFDIRQTRIYTTEGAHPKVAAHELAHTFGMQHSATADPFVPHEYGDHSDILGGGPNAPLAQMNAPRAVKFGFLPTSAIQDVSSSGTFALEAIEINPEMAKSKQALRIHRTGEGREAEYFYLSRRRPIGIDSGLARYTHDEIRSASYVDRVSVHRFKPDALGYRERMTYLVGLLKEKESFSDKESGITVTIDSLRDDGANVKVTIARSNP